MASSQRLAVQRSPAYKPAGIKSYVYAMTKYGFHPTKPGPYFQAKVLSQQGKFGRVGGRMRSHYVLRKRSEASAPGDAQTKAMSSSDDAPTEGEVPAEDIQNDSLYLGDAVLKAMYAIFDMNNGEPRFGWVQRKEKTQSTDAPPAQ